MQNPCPEDCPNRKPDGDRQTGKWTGYGFSVFLLLLCLIFGFEEKDGHYRLKNEPPIAAWSILLPLAGIGLGVQVDSEAVGRIVGDVATRLKP